MTLRELIQLLRRATDVSEIDKYRDEIAALIPETKIISDLLIPTFDLRYQEATTN